MRRWNVSRLATYRGDNETFSVIVRDPAGTVVALTGATLRFTAKYRASDVDDDALITKTTGAGITHDADQVGAGKGKATIAFVPADTATLAAPLVLVWDVQLQDAATLVQTVAGGSLRIRADVSRTAP
jgi:hypothetical protein